MTPDPDGVIVNLSARPGRDPVLKLELPRVPVDAVMSLLRDADGATLRAHQAAVSHLQGRDVFPYVGIRWEPGQPRELAFYVDARKVA